MVKRLIFIAAVMVFFTNISYAKKEKTAQVKDKIATDLKYGWKLSIPDNWKAKGNKEPNVERLFLEKKNYQVNPYIKEYGGNYTIPRIMIFMQDFSGSTDDFENLIKKSLDEHRTDNDIITKLGLLKDSDFIISADVQLGDKIARQIYVKKNYRRMLYIPEGGGGISEGREEYINDHEVHEIYLMKVNEQILVYQGYCEREFYESNSKEFQDLMAAIQF